MRSVFTGYLGRATLDGSLVKLLGVNESEVETHVQLTVFTMRVVSATSFKLKWLVYRPRGRNYLGMFLVVIKTRCDIN